MLHPTQISWVILAGGQASRMGGRDKGLLKLNQTPLIQLIIDKLARQTDQILINANRNQSEYKQFGPVFGDEFKDFQGPLGGIHAGLTHATSEWVGFVPCDSPFINDDLVQRFCEQAGENDDILVAHDGQFQQPVYTLFHKRVLPVLTRFLERGERKIVLLYKECKVKNVDFRDSPDCFINLNTPEELQQFGTLTT